LESLYTGYATILLALEVTHFSLASISFRFAIVGQVGIPWLFSIFSAGIGAVLGYLIAPLVTGGSLGYCIALFIVLIDYFRIFAHVGPRAILFITLIALTTLASTRWPRVFQIVPSAVGGTLFLIGAVGTIITGDINNFGFRILFFDDVENLQCGAQCIVISIFYFTICAVSILVQWVRSRKEIEEQKKKAAKKPAATKKSFAPDKLFMSRSLSNDNLLADSNPVQVADFNYFEEDSMTPRLRGIYSEYVALVEDVGVRFGFQVDNIKNQKEHMLFLLANSTYRDPQRGVDSVHQRLFSNYRQWCRFLKIAPLATSTRSNKRQAKLKDIAVFLLAWGEAANVRELPECMCYILHSLLEEVKEGENVQYPPGTYLGLVIKPIYDHVKKAQGSSKNYDDINEFFWTRNCLKYRYGMPNTDQEVKADGSSSVTKQHIVEGLEGSHKTFMERRSHLRFIVAYSRIFSFLIILFHFVAMHGFLDYFDLSEFDGLGFQIACSVVLTISLLSLLRELLELWANFGVWSQTGFVVRILVKYFYFAILTVVYIRVFTESGQAAENSWTAFEVLAWIYLIPVLYGVLENIFPTHLTGLTSMILNLPVISTVASWWNPLSALYVGRNMADSFLYTLRYQFFWGSMLAFKTYCSYKFQVAPLVPPSIEIVKNAVHDRPYFPGSRFIVLFTMWIPFILIFMLDVVIWFSVWQAFAGAVVGIVFEKLGTIRDFPTIKTLFLGVPRLFVQKLVGSTKVSQNYLKRKAALLKSYESNLKKVVANPDELEEPLLDGDDSGVEQKDSRPGTHVNLKPLHSPGARDKGGISMFQSETWQIFSMAWNEIVKDMRTRDLLSNDEFEMLTFRKVAGRDDRSLYIPSFLTAGCFERFLRYAEEAAFTYSKLGSEASKSAEVMEEFEYHLKNNPLLVESILEVWELGMWVLQSLLGERHYKQIYTINQLVITAVNKKEVLTKFKLDKLEKLKPALMDLCRILTLTAKMKKSKPKKDESKEAKESKEDSVNKMTSVMSFGTLTMLDKMQRSKTPDRELVLIRKQVRGLLDTVSGLLTGSSQDFSSVIKAITVDKEGFFWQDGYARHQVDALVTDPMCAPALKGISMLLNLATIDARPQSAEAQRRLLFFVNSLFMDMPALPLVSDTMSLTTLTPFYAEDIIYSKPELEAETQDGVTSLMYLQTIHTQEWRNFLERIGLPPSTDRASILSSEHSLEARLWATKLGQTLYRTVKGMMLYEDAIRLSARIELPDANDEEIEEVVKLKYTYVVSAQVYGQQKKTLDSKSVDIEYLLRTFPNLRIAYIDTVKVRAQNEKGEPVEVDEFYSVLIKAHADKYADEKEQKEIQEVYRIKLPGNPILGEGKPENQNHAIVFTRGEIMQAIDMNQENYFEEALKMRNLVQLFPESELEGGQRPMTILGFREHIFTGALSSIANFMALQERTFVSLGQRVLHNPMRLRFHYGHPDLFDKMFFMGRGGVSKASKGVNLSEDVFAGYSNVLRGGYVGFTEFILVGKGRDVGLQQLFKFDAKLSQGSAEQSLSRDVYRLGQTLDFFRLWGLWTGGPGFYISNTLTIWAVFMIAYIKLWWALFGTEYVDVSPAMSSLTYWFGQISFLMTLPLVAALGVDIGFRSALWEVVKMVITGGPFYFMFSMATKWYYFGQTLVAGGASYRATGRGFVTQHETFAELYRFYFFSHFLASFELMITLLLYKIFLNSPYENYGAITWPMWLLAISWWFAPILFNPMAFEWEKAVTDIDDWLMWMRRSQGEANASWKVWWKEETAFYEKLTVSKRIFMLLGYLRFWVVGFGLLYHSNALRLWQNIVGGAVSLAVIFLVWCVSHERFHQRYGRLSLFPQIAALLFVIAVPLLFLNEYDMTFGDVFGPSSMYTFLGLVYFLGGAVCMLIVCGFQWWSLRELCRLHHYFIGLVLLVFLGVTSIIYIPSIIQTRALFHNAFNKGVIMDDLLRGGGRKKNQ
jgi:callose synthase